MVKKSSLRPRRRPPQPSWLAGVVIISMGVAFAALAALVHWSGRPDPDHVALQSLFSEIEQRVAGPARSDERFRGLPVAGDPVAPLLVSLAKDMDRLAAAAPLRLKEVDVEVDRDSAVVTYSVEGPPGATPDRPRGGRFLFTRRLTGWHLSGHSFVDAAKDGQRALVGTHGAARPHRHRFDFGLLTGTLAGIAGLTFCAGLAVLVWPRVSATRKRQG